MPNDQTPQPEVARCELCGEPMPPGEQRFRFHGYSGPCPRQSPTSPVADLIAEARDLKRLATLLQSDGKKNVVISCRKAIALADLAERQQAEIERQDKLLLAAYNSGHRKGWEDGPAVSQVMDDLHDYLAEKGLVK